MRRGCGVCKSPKLFFAVLPSPSTAWESETLRSRDPTWVPNVPCVSTATPCGQNYKKDYSVPPPLAVTKQVFRFSFRMGKVSQGEKSKNDYNPNEPCHYLKVNLVFPRLQNGDDGEVHYLLSSFRNYPVTQQGKWINPCDSVSKQTKVSTSQTDSQIISLQQGP